MPEVRPSVLVQRGAKGGPQLVCQPGMGEAPPSTGGRSVHVAVVQQTTDHPSAGVMVVDQCAVRDYGDWVEIHEPPVAVGGKSDEPGSSLTQTGRHTCAPQAARPREKCPKLVLGNLVRVKVTRREIGGEACVQSLRSSSN